MVYYLVLFLVISAVMLLIFRGNLPKVISAMSYLTFGLVGFLWIIIAAIKKVKIISFLKFNIFQSIILSLILYLFELILRTFLTLVQPIPFLGRFFVNVVYYVIDMPILSIFSFYKLCLIGLFVYCFVNIFLNKYPEIPYVSKWVKRII